MPHSPVEPVRTRFAPSPTGYLHLGGARTALFSWAYARHHCGSFILRIEDTDLERSQPAAVQAILDAMSWLELDYDEGPFYQTQHLDRYRAVIARMLAEGTAYHCFASPEELEAMRESQRAHGEKPRYDGRWRPEPGKTLPPPPAGIRPVVRFRNPLDGDVSWDDLVKGPITISNAELDDLVIARADGAPTYNFCVCVDDDDMRISHVIRGDDHINNTPRQINILRALGADVPVYGHLPMILGPDGEKLSKRHGAVSVMQYEEDGYLPESMINYLARLGWSHGNDELFTRDQLVEWFDVDHLTKSAAQWDPRKLAWVNNHYIKLADDRRLAKLVQPRIERSGGVVQGAPVEKVIALMKGRCETLAQLAEEAMLFYGPVARNPDLVRQHVNDAVKPVLAEFTAMAPSLEWNREAIQGFIKTLLAKHRMKMPQFAVPLRVLVTGRTQTPSLDAVLELLGREAVLERLRNFE